MAKIWKELLRPGSYHVPTGDEANPVRVCTFTANDVRNACKQGNAMLRAGWQVPSVWEHQDAGPVRLSRAQRDANFARFTNGFVQQYKTEGDHLYTLLDVDDKDVPQLKRVKFTSPEMVYNWIDSDGKKWPGYTVAHVAITPKPIQRNQETFRLSYAGRTTRPTRVRLSLADRVGGEVMADETVENDNLDIDAGEGLEAAGGKLTTALACLSRLGLMLGEDTPSDMDAFLDRLIVACETKEAHENENPEDDFPDENELPADPAAGDVGVSSQTPPISMSYRKQQDLAATMARKNLASRIATLVRTGRITPAIQTKLNDAAKSVRLSFTTSGDLANNTVLAQVEAYEALPRNTAWGKKTRLSHSVGAVAHPDGTDDKATMDDWNKTRRRR